MHNQHIRQQFNLQAHNFANWSVVQNSHFLQGYFNFCLLKPCDTLLDVACGTGDFANFAAQQGIMATGTDISDIELEIAKEKARRSNVTNATFVHADVENLPFPKNSFSMVVCKWAFHHFEHPNVVFAEMKRCCKPGGRISIQDMVAYPDEYVNKYFEALDNLVDPSHNRALKAQELRDFYTINRIGWVREQQIKVELNLNEYIGHAQQTPEVLALINAHVKNGLEDKRLNDFLYRKENDIVFVRPVLLIIGRRQGS
jgi:ubiquinone/menaquinone biosynthesis C-methylase UbiE